MVRVVCGASRVVVVTEVSGGVGVDVAREPVATVSGAFVVVAGTTWPVPDPPPAHAPTSTPAPRTRPQHHTRMGRTLTAAAFPDGGFRATRRYESPTRLDSGDGQILGDSRRRRPAGRGLGLHRSG
ncbi:hypothetical protein GCM10027598_78840 [Amycolatopsis oliviviridis]|uniref:Uncharacterized protein n=1 Tax=Amycolatopsis oliviviridis TaxID=1471590 RepID=A0ABQ3L5A7_9PSEU|nr:hypothetical protein GCM10017790_08770 [Amycolatopsis oliviviridis]